MYGLYRAQGDEELDHVIDAFLDATRIKDPSRGIVLKHCINREALRTVCILDGDLDAVFGFLLAEDARIGPPEWDVE